jgi:hypothetical protein
MATSKNERLHALVALLNPPAAAQYAKNGSWPTGGAPYVLDTLHDGAIRRVRISSAVGDTFAGTGPTVADALTALEDKLTTLGIRVVKADKAAKEGAQ